MLNKMLSRVSAAVRARPLLSTAVSGAASGAIGDGLAQGVERAESRAGAAESESEATIGVVEAPFDWRRWAGQTSFGCFCSCFMMRPWYSWLDKRVGERVTIRNVGLKVGLLLERLYCFPVSSAGHRKTI
eukprot:SAG31_NODE_9906_length_1213_cov_1.321364_1_plen_130_part_00